MTDTIEPSHIEIGGVEQYSDDEEILNVMSKIKKIESSDSFQQQFVDLGGEGEPLVQFSSELETSDDQELVNIRRRDSEEDDEEFLQIYLDFPYESIVTFNATLNDILEIIESLTVEYLQIQYRLDFDLTSIDIISEIDDSVEYDIQGIQIGEDEYVYTFQGGAEDASAVVATLQEEPEIGPNSNEDFIKDEVDTATRFVEGVCNG